LGTTPRRKAEGGPEQFSSQKLWNHWKLSSTFRRVRSQGKGGDGSAQGQVRVKHYSALLRILLPSAIGKGGKLEIQATSPSGLGRQRSTRRFGKIKLGVGYTCHIYLRPHLSHPGWCCSGELSC